MKKSTILSILIAICLSALLYGCSQDEAQQAVILPQQKIENPTRNARPAAMPDFDVFPFFVSGTITSDASYYHIPFSCKEHNIGTGDGFGGQDTLKVYLKKPIPGGGYVFYVVGNYMRPSNLPSGGTYYINAVVHLPRGWRPADGNINLVIKADAGNQIMESDETNNYSPTIWNIYLP
jgi:CARDB